MTKRLEVALLLAPGRDPAMMARDLCLLPGLAAACAIAFLNIAETIDEP